jgi:hypothetical protein
MSVENTIAPAIGKTTWPTSDYALKPDGLIWRSDVRPFGQRSIR